MSDRPKFRALPASLEGFGIAIDFLSRFEPFSTTRLGSFARVVRRQILRSEHVAVFDGERLVGYAGWLPTTEAAAQAWAQDGGDLRPVDSGADAAALTTVAVDDPKVTLGLLRAAREINPGRRIFFKRSYDGASRQARKASVLNRTGIAPAPAAAAKQAIPDQLTQDITASSGQPKRPPIAADPCGFLYALAERAPGATESVPIGGTSLLIVQDPALAAHVLVGNLANYGKNFASFTPFFGRSRLTLDGDPWRRSQRVSQSHIAPHDIGRAAAIVSRLYADLADELAATGGAAGPIDGALDRAAVATLTEIAFSTPLAALGDGFAADLRPIVRYAAGRAWDVPGVPGAVDAATLAQAQAATGRIRSAIGGMVDRRRAGPSGNDALSALISAADDAADGPGRQTGEGEGIDLAGELLTLVLAGSDTTSASLGWALSILAAIPPFQEQLREEVRAAFGDREPALDDLDRAPSLRPFLDETLRMFPPVAILSRIAQGPDTLDGHPIAAGDRVLVSVIGLHQNPASWDAPREFRLERHAADAPGRTERRTTFMPFSAGPRICGGARFAQLELAIALIQIVRTCRLDLPAPLPLAFDWGASMRRRGGQKVRVTPL